MIVNVSYIFQSRETGFLRKSNQSIAVFVLFLFIYLVCSWFAAIIPGWSWRDLFQIHFGQMKVIFSFDILMMNKCNKKKNLIACIPWGGVNFCLCGSNGRTKGLEIGKTAEFMPFVNRFSEQNVALWTNFGQILGF